jgi:hypothetical protein
MMLAYIETNEITLGVVNSGSQETMASLMAPGALLEWKHGRQWMTTAGDTVPWIRIGMPVRKQFDASSG